MQMPICSRCKKNVAVVFITKMDPSNPNTSEQEGLCLKCARELGIKPLDEMMERMGITDETLEMLSNEIGSIEDLAALMPVGQTGEEEEDADDADVPAEASRSPLDMLREYGRRVHEPAGEKKKENKKRKHLNKYCEDLTNKARMGRIDRIVGRDSETDRVIQILNRRQKNNPCLIGEPGVGKTAIAEGLALRIAQGNVPAKLRDKEIHLLDLTGLVAGTQFRGQFESRVKGLIEEVKALGNIILVIDEVHNIVGAGESEGAMNAANILKPALSRGEIQVIGATTFAEYRKYIEKDAALERRFKPVSVAEPSIEEASLIMQGIAKAYAEFHGVEISPEIAHQ
ncbi:MAG: ATP-dependent Clp protease ATP-binding subunit, partial [Butyricicoccus sp.]|nr:ATP-dependent Clp protease ATP-binding subunit [Butyricicoccus sp.]